ncbi:hypothetical protein TRFO_26397 [Tritrichomonas foetus]|uniref:UBR-type domain-containing protein n=1 Tax=Tritrichomonas foetus TaxID=1144522 RepID=A0A1J4K4A3_9EUKA|nr:hypothetical protein TRFO_26397 [Tritrichomonas foetus]|eukprot:OHT05794.1 hypothetical protein TRFO_26397 [Tritrichomonas foetus]
MAQTNEFFLEKIFPDISNARTEFKQDEWRTIDLYSNFRLRCIYTSVDNPQFSTHFSDTRFEPLVTFTFTELESTGEEYFIFCCQETLAVIKINKSSDHIIFPLLELMAQSFLNPTNPDDLSKFVSHTENQQDIFPFNLVNHGDAFTELNNFMKYYSKNLELPETKEFTLSTFLRLSLRTSLLFLIRRNYFPSTWFYDQSFFAKSQILLLENDLIQFSFDDFVFLRFLSKNSNNNEALYLHKKTGSLFSIKSYLSKKLFEVEKEVFSKVKCQFIRPCYGFIKGSPFQGKRNSLVLEFMSNGTAFDLLKNDNLEEIMKSKIITETLLGLDTLNAKGFAMCSFDQRNVYFDHDVCSYLSDFDTIKFLNERVSIIFFNKQVQLFGLFIKAVGGQEFPKIESGPIVHLFDVCTTNTHEEVQTIFSLVYILKTRKLFFSWTSRDKIFDLLKRLFDTQIIQNRKDVSYLFKKSNQNDSNACYILGSMYFQGNLLPVSTTSAIYHWIKATSKCSPATYQLALYFEFIKIPGYFTMLTSLASNGHVLSQMHIGMCYLSQKTEFYDPAKGYEWINVAAHSNSPEAYYILGKLYEEGTVVKYDITKAVSCYQKAADLFYAKALYELGRIYFKGIGVEQCTNYAFSYLSYASLAGVNEANIILADIYRMNASLQPNEDEKMLKNMPYGLLVTAANNGSVKAMRKIYKLTLKEKRKHDDRSSYYLRLASSKQDPKALNEISELVRMGGNIANKDESQAQEWCRLAADLGNARSMYRTAVNYLENNTNYNYSNSHIYTINNTKSNSFNNSFISSYSNNSNHSFGYHNENIEIGLDYLMKAIDRNEPMSKLYLGIEYLKGKIVPQNIEKGTSLILSSACQSNVSAYEQLGVMYMEDNYYRHDYERAFFLLTHALRCGLISPQYYLGVIYEDGLGLEVNKQHAFNLYRKCFQYNVEAMIRMAAMMSTGVGTPQNKAEALNIISRGVYYRVTKRARAELLRYIAYDRQEEKMLSQMKWYNKNDIKDSGDYSGLEIHAKYLEEGFNSEIEVDYERSLKLYKKAAQHENVEAMYSVGRFYEKGLGVEIDLDLAFSWYSEASNRGHLEATYKCGYMLMHGIGTHQNIKQAQVKLIKAAEECHVEATSELAHLLYSKNDYTNAFQLASAAASYGNVNAQILLARLYYDGHGVEKDSKMFLKYLYLAEQNGSAEAQYLIGQYYEDDVGDMNHAFHWYTKAAQHEYTEAELKVAQMLYEGQGICQDSKQALKWYKRAAKKGNALAMLHTARMYSQGNGVQVNKIKAVKYFKLAAEHGNSSAMYQYAQMLEKGIGMEEADHEAAYEWYSLAAKKGESKAFGRIMHIYACGIRLRKVDTPIAKLQELADSGNITAMIDLGDIFYYGAQGCRDIAHALELYQKAADLGNDIAQYKLAVIYEGTDKAKSTALFEKSAKSGNLASMVFISDIYNKNKQYNNALYWYDKCSKAGLTHAKLVIGRMYADGQGTPVNKAKALQYFKEASESGSAEAKFECAKMLIEEKNPNIKNIIKLLKEAADGDCGDAMNMLGLMFREGLGCPVDEKRAKLWFSRGSSSGSNQATLNLAKMNYDGKQKDMTTALALFQKASKKGSIVAKLYLAKIIKNGEGTQKDETKAGELYMEAARMEGMDSTDAGLEDLRLAASCRNPSACAIIGERLMKGLEGERGEAAFKKAYSLFQTASKSKITKALYNLGMLCEAGRGTAKNIDRAIQFYKEAAEEGSELALARLKELAPDIKLKKVEECSFTKSGENPIRMHAFECISCGLLNENSICVKCAFKCHKSHELFDAGFRSNTFCHCGCHSQLNYA